MTRSEESSALDECQHTDSISFERESIEGDTAGRPGRWICDNDVTNLQIVSGDRRKVGAFG